MATTETLLLLLGVVSIFEPVNGYQIRRELVSWGVEEWANIRPGSIYNGLTTLTQRGELQRHDLLDGTRDVAVYELSEQGRSEFRRLFEEALTVVRPTAPLALHTALSLMPLVGRDEVRRLLGVRLERLEQMAVGHGHEPLDPAHVPPHVLAMTDYWRRLATVERDWLRALIARVEAGDFGFAGEPLGWTPAADDPGHQMSADRERYLALLGR